MMSAASALMGRLHRVLRHSKRQATLQTSDDLLRLDRFLQDGRRVRVGPMGRLVADRLVP